MQILSQKQVVHKTKRLAIEIVEHNLDAKSFIFLGINSNGYEFAKRLMQVMPSDTKQPTLGRILINPAAPLDSAITIEGVETKSLKKSNIVLVDDVANTGRTLFYALKPLLETLPNKVQIAVLVDRRHKSFPIVPDYVGLTLATTLKDNIVVEISNKRNQAVFLK